MAIFKGAGVAIATPFYADGSVNYDEFAKLIDFQIENGTDAIIVCGTTGESATLSEEEHVDVIRYCVEKVGGRIPVVAGTGSNSTETAIMLSKAAEEAGADAVLVVTPYYNKATQKGLIRHYKMVAESISLPVIMYNVPSRTGCNILPKTAVTLCREVENIVGIKDAVGNVAQTAAMMNRLDGKLDLYSGEDGLVVPLMSLGGIGVISVVADVAPKDMHDMCMAYLNGDVKKAKEMQLKMLPLVDALFSEVNPIPVKKAMNLMGLEVGPLRAPLFEMDAAKAVVLEKVMREYGILK